MSVYIAQICQLRIISLSGGICTKGHMTIPMYVQLFEGMSAARETSLCNIDPINVRVNAIFIHHQLKCYIVSKLAPKMKDFPFLACLGRPQQDTDVHHQPILLLLAELAKRPQVIN